MKFLQTTPAATPTKVEFPPPFTSLSDMKHYTVKNITTSERLYQYLLDSNKIKAGDCFVNGNENFLDSDGVHAMSFFNHVSSKPEYFGLHSRTAVKAAGECYITPAEKLFLKMVGPAVSKRAIRAAGVRREFLVSKGCVFEDAIGPFCIYDTYRAARNDKFVKTVADKHKKYGFKSAAAVYEAAEMTPREFGTGDRKKNVWSDFIPLPPKEPSFNFNDPLDKFESNLPLLPRPRFLPYALGYHGKFICYDRSRAPNQLNVAIRDISVIENGRIILYARRHDSIPSENPGSDKLLFKIDHCEPDIFGVLDKKITLIVRKDGNVSVKTHVQPVPDECAIIRDVKIAEDVRLHSNIESSPSGKIIFDGIEVDWPYTTIPDEPPKQKDCTCDLQTVLMVTGCKCGAMKCN